MSRIPIKMIARLAGLEAAQLARRLARRLGVRRPPELDPSIFEPPDSGLCTRAAEVARAASSETLFNHCMRTWAFGVAVGEQLGAAPDRELLFAAAAMHDLGLTRDHAGADWFERRGAAAARSICEAQGIEATRAALVEEAVFLHDQIDAAKREPEIALVHFGAGVDVIGFHIEDVAPGAREVIIARWPRHAMKTEIAELLGREAARNPDSPVGVQFRLGFARRIAKAPFSS